MSERSRAWCITLQNETDPQLFIDFVTSKWPNVTYAVAGAEVAPETKRNHLQCYVYLPNCVTFTSVRRTLQSKFSAHVEKAHGSPAQNRTYCIKDNTYSEYGTLPKQGKRKDIEVVRDWLQNPVPLPTVLEQAPSLQALQVYMRLRSQFVPLRRDWTMEVHYHYGPSGTGKSKLAWTNWPNAYAKESSHKWFDGYDPLTHETVIIDDLRPESFPFPYLLRLLDRYPMQVETKFGTVPFLAKRVVITSILKPEDIVPPSEPPGQLRRRLTKVTRFDALSPTDNA